MNITVALIGVIGFAIVGPLVLAAVIAGVMVWLSRQVSTGAVPAPTPAPAARRPVPAAPPVATKLELVPTVAPTPEVLPATTDTEVAGFEREETHERVVPVWLVAVYVFIIAWALWYIGTQVVPFFKPLTP